MDDFVYGILSAWKNPEISLVKLDYKPGENVAVYKALTDPDVEKDLFKPISNMWEFTPGIVLTQSERIHNFFFHRRRWELIDPVFWNNYQYSFKHVSFKEPIVGIIPNIGRLSTNDLASISAFAQNHLKPVSNPESNWHFCPLKIEMGKL